MFLLKWFVHHNGTKLLTSVLIWKNICQPKKKNYDFSYSFFLNYRHMNLSVSLSPLVLYQFSKSFSTSNLNTLLFFNNKKKFRRTKLSFMKWHQPHHQFSLKLRSFHLAKLKVDQCPLLKVWSHVTTLAICHCWRDDLCCYLV